MGWLGLLLGSAAAAMSAMLFFMLTAFGGGGLVAPGRPPLSRGVERYLNLSLVAGPIACVLLGLPPWLLRGSGWWFAGPPALVAIQIALILSLFGKR